MFCQYCGATLAPDSPFCTSCGRQQPAGATNVPKPFIPPNGVKVETGRWLSEAWNLVLSEWAMFALVTLLFLVVGSAVPIILQGPMAVGIHIVCARKIETAPRRLTSPASLSAIAGAKGCCSSDCPRRADLS